MEGDTQNKKKYANVSKTRNLVYRNPNYQKCLCNKNQTRLANPSSERLLIPQLGATR